MPDSDLLEKVTSGGLVTEYGYETHRNLKTQVRNTWAPPPANETVLSQYDYRYDELGRRESVENSGTAFINGEKSVFHNIHAYNDRNELTGSERKAGTVAAPAAVVDAEGRLYEYDPIGNRINSAGGTDPQVTYARNAVNQYTALTGGVNASPAYDDDGNMTACDGATYTWNAENRLIAAETADKRITFLYDYMGRRVQKKVYSGTPGSWNASPDETRVFVYDGWNLIRETVSGTASGETYYVWGFDLSQSMQGAGGIGGLLCSVSGGEVRQYTYDANGNVGQLVNEDGVIVTRYEYDPFGNEIVAEGAGAQGNPFRFSTKYHDVETGLYYYGFRYYHTELGRWISRDPIEEKGGINLYLFVENNSINLIDINGLIPNLFEWLKDLIIDKEKQKIEKERADERRKLKEYAQEMLRNKEIKKSIRSLIKKSKISPGGDGFEHTAFCYKNIYDPEDICCVYAKAEMFSNKRETAYEIKEPGPCKCKQDSKNYQFYISMHTHENNESFPIPSGADLMPEALGGLSRPLMVIAMQGNVAIAMEGKHTMQIFKFYTDDKGRTYE
ncbi:RHS repeat-associated core domain-containing pro tein [Desulfonema ishimotonii]|uniref:RHS repeat-associated core domain-containing pro tein n=1 Tax=Desulfonema ishimotonii TaxID=45657 RepID=A0A401G0X6_9BACT|nr:RHS repeat-associated core domain-containing protein [Desulfonema ishimotonii]GBC62869.1 RHS repeat-associated core domain-containing pro tein [Desulfonema ishimotonii]